MTYRLLLASLVSVFLCCADAHSQETIKLPDGTHAASKKSDVKLTYLTVRVTTDSKGKIISAVITKSSGSTILDQHCAKYAKENWHGPPNTTGDVPCYYKVTGSSSTHH